MTEPSGPPSYHELKVTVLVSLLAWPIVYFVEWVFTNVSQYSKSLVTFVMMSTGFFILVVVPLLLSRLAKMSHWLGYVFMLFAFTAMIDLVISLEYWNFISGFVSHYLALGEPYLHSSWGCAIALFDGIGYYWMYLLLIYQMANGKSWRSSGIFWASSITNSMIVLLFSVFAGKHAPTYCTFLNAPYAFIPLGVLFWLLSSRDDKGKEWRDEVHQVGTQGKVMNLLLALGFVLSMWITFSKGMLSLGSTFTIFQKLRESEPLLFDQDPAPFAKIQCILNLFYILPIQGVSLFYIFRRRKPQLVWDLGCMNAGVVLQAQFSLIVTALDSKANPAMKSDIFDLAFWSNNLALLVIPQVFLWTLYNRHYVPRQKPRTE